MNQERPNMSCSGCSHWQRLEVEGSPGTPLRVARPGWGSCHLHNLDLVRMKGFLETRETFYCQGYRELVVPTLPVAKPQLLSPDNSITAKLERGDY